MSKNNVVRGKFGRLFKPSSRTSAEEAATFASMTNAGATATVGFAERNAQRAAYAIRWLKALQDVAKYAELAFGQVAEEALLDTVPENEADMQSLTRNLATLYDVPEQSKSPRMETSESVTAHVGADFATDSDGETEKVAATEPPPPMNRAQRRMAAAEGRPVGPPAGPRVTPRPPVPHDPKDKAHKQAPGKGNR